MKENKSLRDTIARKLVEHVKPILMLRWEATVQSLQNKHDDSGDAVQKAFLEGCSAGYWNGVTDGIDVGFDLGKQETPQVGLLH